MRHLILCAALLCAPITPVLASDWTFKTVKPPSSSSSAKRINIQIAPVKSSTPAPAVPLAPSDAPKPPSNLQPWFWDIVTPTLAPPESGRFSVATALAGKAPAGSGIAAPSLQVLSGIASAHGRDILINSVGTRVSPALALAVIAVESSGRTDAVSSAGAEGLMQLIPATAERFGVTDSKDPSQNIAGGLKYLDWLMGEFYGDPLLALAGYNAGEGAVRKHGGVPPFAETRAYVPKVLAAWNVARQLCLTPPELPSDGCVFTVGS